MATIKTDLICNLNQPVNVTYLHGNLFSQDNAGNTINVFVMDNGEPATIGGTVSANVIRSDGQTVAVSGAIEGNKAYVILPQACYAVPGVVHIIIKLTQNTTITTIAAIVANVYMSTTDAVIDPGQVIPSIQALMALIEEAVDSIPTDYTGLLHTIAADYSSSKTYKVGDYAWESGVLKRCIVPITAAETYTAAHWTNAVIGDDLTNLKSAMSGSQAYVFEIGSIASADGQDLNLNNRIRCKPFYAMSGQIFSVSTEENILALFQYDYNGNYVRMVTDGSFLSTATAPENGVYRIVMKKDASGSAITGSDIPTIAAKIVPSVVDYPLPFINKDELNAYKQEINPVLNGISESVKTHTVQYDKNDLNPSPGYININGGISAVSGSSGYYYSATTLHLVTGDVITFKSSTESFANTAVIAEKLTSTSYKPLVIGSSGTSIYSYTVLHDGDYAFTFGGGATNYVVITSLPVINRQISNIAESFLSLDDINYLPMFSKVACLGDSLTRGYNTSYPDVERNRDFGYPWVLARKTQLKVWNYGHSGATPSYLYTDLRNNDFSSFDLAIICLGRNGGIQSDDDKTAYQNLITKLLTDNAHMTIFICSLPAYTTERMSKDIAINERIQAIASANNLPYIDIWGDYGGVEYRTGDVHYNPMGYVKMCNAIIKGINKYISEHLTDFMNLWMPNTLPRYIDGQVF